MWAVLNINLVRQGWPLPLMKGQSFFITTRFCPQKKACVCVFKVVESVWNIYSKLANAHLLFVLILHKSFQESRNFFLHSSMLWNHVCIKLINWISSRILKFLHRNLPYYVIYMLIARWSMISNQEDLVSITWHSHYLLCLKLYSSKRSYKAIRRMMSSLSL